MCSCLSISGMTWETLKWKMFPLSLIGRVNQWYTNDIESTNGDCDELKDKFYLAFFPMSCISSLPRAILDFEQHEESPGPSFQCYYTLAQTCLYPTTYCCDSFVWVLT
jgi:hypothetical protein